MKFGSVHNEACVIVYATGHEQGNEYELLEQYVFKNIKEVISYLRRREIDCSSYYNLSLYLLSERKLMPFAYATDWKTEETIKPLGWSPDMYALC